MAKDDAAGADTPLDSLWLNRVYPDAGATLGFAQAPIDTIKDDCIVVLDANVLLLPYRLGATSLEELRRVFDSLAQGNRIFAPAQAIREFLKHRADKIRDIVRELSKQASQINIIADRKIGFLQNDADYLKLVELSEQVKLSKAETLRTIEAIAAKLRTGVGSDPVSLAYREIFAGRVMDLPESIDIEALHKEMSWRYRHSVPPGYKDHSKPDEGIGDFLIWKTILQLAKDHHKSCIFVTEDAKSDWWVQSEGAFQPRLELVDEYRRESEGQTIHLMPLSDLLALYGAQQGAVEDTKRAEEAPSPRTIRRTSLQSVSTSEDLELDSLSLLELARIERELDKESNRVANEYNSVEARIRSVGDEVTETEFEELTINKSRLFEQLRGIIQKKSQVTQATARIIAER